MAEEDVEMESSLAEQIGAAIGDAQSAASSEDKHKALARAEEMLLNRDRDGHLLDNFLDEMLEFVGTPDARLRCFIASFIEKAVKKDTEVLKKAITSLSYLITADGTGNVTVMKKVISVCSQVYPLVLRWAVAKRNDREVERCWEAFSLLKGRIMQLIDSDNEGVRTMTIKFLETVVLSQSMKTENSEAGKADMMCLNDIPRDHLYISFRKMQAEAQHTLQSLLNQTTLSHISAQNLLTVVSSIVNIGRQRPEPDFLLKVVDAIEILHVNLPPTLGTSQVKSVRKELKMHLLRLLKHPSALHMHPRITTLLTDLGATNNEVNRAMPANIAELRRKAGKRPADGDEPAAKKTRVRAAAGGGGPSTSSAPAIPLEEDDYDEGEEKPAGGAGGGEAASRAVSAIDITAQFIFDRLHTHVVANLVLISLVTLPEEMPAAFQSSYTPIAAAGTEAQRRHLSRMMATQATQAEIGPGVEQMKREQEQQYRERESARREGVFIPPTPAHSLVNSAHRADRERERKRDNFAKPEMPAPAVPKSKAQLNLMTVTKELSQEEMVRLIQLAFQRIMRSEKRAVQGGAGPAHHAILVRLTARFHAHAATTEKMLVDFILEEQKTRTELALLWIAELYAQYQGFSICYALDKEDGRMTKEERLTRYDRVMCMLLETIFLREEHNQTLFHKILLESPLVTQGALAWLQRACLDTLYGVFGLTTLREMILTRGRQRTELCQLLLSFIFHPDRNDLRGQVLATVKELYELPYLRCDVRALLEDQVEKCRLPAPPSEFFPCDAPNVVHSWSETVYRTALYVHLAMMPTDHTLVHSLAAVYAKSNTDFKRIALRTVETPIKAMGIESVELLRLMDDCPEGAETLVARIVHLLTERNAVTREVVVRIKKLHETRKTDLRSMIPVLTGLDREDLLALLPRFVFSLSTQRTVPAMLKKILQGRSVDTGEPPMTAVDLLVEFHKLQPKDEEERKLLLENMPVFISNRAMTRESVSTAIEEMLAKLRPLPNLFYHTLLHVYTKFTALDGFLSNVLLKITREGLWKEDKELFYSIIRQMGSCAYRAILNGFCGEDMTEYLDTPNKTTVVKDLKEFLHTLSSTQQNKIPESILDMIKDKEERQKDKERERAREKEKEQREKEREQREKEREERRRREDKKDKEERRKDKD